MGTPRQLPLSFCDADDIQSSTYGRIEFGCHVLKDRGALRFEPCNHPGCVALRDVETGWVYGWSCHDEQGRFDPAGPLRIIRSRTDDGVTFTDAQAVHTDDGEPWLGFVNLARRDTDGRLFAFAWARGKPGHAMHVLSSRDGENWSRIASPAYTDHDACSVMWDAAQSKFVNFQTTYQRWAKRYPDNLPHHRRVLSIRSSSDGINWLPDTNVGLDGPLREADDLIIPDAEDPEELEHYRVCMFPHQRRVMGLLCRYAPSPQIANTREGTLHGPGLGAEWCIWRDGTLRRAHRRNDPTEAIGFVPAHPPIRVGHELFFYRGGAAPTVAAIPADRIFFAFCRANGEFSSLPFTMPDGELCLNVAADEADSYVMAEVHEDGRLIDGFDKARCVHKHVDSRALRLAWDGTSTRSLAGRTVSLRIFLRNARVYCIHTSSDT